MRRLLAVVLAIAVLAAPAFSQTISGPALLDVNGKRGHAIIGAADVGAAPCPGSCVLLPAFFTSLLTVAPTSSQIDVRTAIGDAPSGPITLAYESGHVSASDPLAVFVQSRYSLTSTQMAAVFTLAGAATTPALSPLTFPTLAQLGGLARGSNLSDLSNTSAARVYLGLGSFATLSSLAGIDLSGGTVTALGTTATLAAADLASRGLPLTPQMFGAKCDSNGTHGNGTDDTADMQNAFYAAQAVGGTLKIPGKSTVCRVTSQLVISHSMTLDGDGCQPYTNNPTGPNFGAGSWLYFDHTGKGLYQAIGVPNVQIGRGVYKNFCTLRNQPAPPALGTAWSPTDADFDIYVEQDDSLIEHVMLLDATRGAHLQGRTVVDDLRFDAFKIGLEIDNAHDTPRIHNVHSWVFYADNQAMEQYQDNNLDAIVIRAADNTHISDTSVVGYHNCLHLTSGTTGVANKVHASDLDCDLGEFGVVVDADSITAQFSNFTAQGNDEKNGETTVTSGNALLVSGSHARLGFANFHVTNFGGTAVSVGSTDNAVTLSGQVQINGWGTQAGSTAVAVVANSGSIVTIDDADPLITGGPTGAPVWAGTGAVDLVSKTKVN